MKLKINLVTVAGNLIGALLTFLYFAYIDVNLKMSQGPRPYAQLCNLFYHRDCIHFRCDCKLSIIGGRGLYLITCRERNQGVRPIMNTPRD